MTQHNRSLTRRYLQWALALLAAGALRLTTAFGTESTDPALAITPVEDIRAQAAAAVIALAQRAGLKVNATAAPLDARLRLQRCARALQSTVGDDWQAHEFTTVKLQCDAPVRWNIYVRVAVQSERSVLVAKRALPRGSLLQAGDFETRVKTVGGSSAHYIGDPGSLAGLRLRLPLAEGAALSSDAVEQLPLIKRGQQVTLLARAAGIEIRVAATAMSDGRQSERILVQNQSSHRQVDAVVRTSELVEVGL
jgi:flagella basal body P-ring formation protein FlgA